MRANLVGTVEVTICPVIFSVLRMENNPLSANAAAERGRRGGDGADRIDLGIRFCRETGRADVVNKNVVGIPWMETNLKR